MKVEATIEAVAATASSLPGTREKNGRRVRAAATVIKSDRDIFMYNVVCSSACTRRQQHWSQVIKQLRTIRIY